MFYKLKNEGRSEKIEAAQEYAQKKCNQIFSASR